MSQMAFSFYGLHVVPLVFDSPEVFVETVPLKETSSRVIIPEKTSVECQLVV